MAVVLICMLLVVLAYGIFVEPRWLAIRSYALNDKPDLRVVQISDIHYSGDRNYLKKVVQFSNEHQPDIVCITGDFVSSAGYLESLLELLSDLDAPVYAVIGNWDEWADVDFSLISEFCENTGGRLLTDQSVSVPELNLKISGFNSKSTDWIVDSEDETHILLMHYPLHVELLQSHEFDLILAGHSHGGQVRLPKFGSIFVPYDTGKYDLGMFQTQSGPMYVTSGIGTSALPLRLNCRPEIVVIDL